MEPAVKGTAGTEDGKHQLETTGPIDVPTEGRVGTEDLENLPETTTSLTCVPEGG